MDYTSLPRFSGGADPGPDPPGPGERDSVERAAGVLLAAVAAFALGWSVSLAALFRVGPLTPPG